MRGRRRGLVAPRGLLSALRPVMAAWLLAGCAGGREELSLARAWLEEPRTEAPVRAWPFDGTDAAARPGPEAEGWAIRTLPHAPSPPTAICRGGSGATVKVVADDAPADLEARVRVWAAAGDRESAGLVFRWRDAANFYLARASSRNNHVRLYRRQDGHWTLLASRDLAVPVGQWHELAVRARGTELMVALDGEPLLRRHDNQFLAGGVGLWVEAGAEACFDDLRLAPFEGRR